MENERDPNEPLRSKDSIHNSFVLFVNKTQRDVDVYWVDYEGTFVHYMKLDPAGRTIINTFSTHPWIFKDTSTGERMHAEHSDVFWPKPFFVLHNSQPVNMNLIRRKQIDIHFPLRTLRHNAMWSIVRQLRTKKDVDKLEIPKILRNEILAIFNDYERHKEKMRNRRFP